MVSSLGSQAKQPCYSRLREAPSLPGWCTQDGGDRSQVEKRQKGPFGLITMQQRITDMTGRR